MTSDALELREITAETVRAVTALAVAPEQDGYVAPNAVSIAEAYFEPKAWFRALACGDDLVGFAMVYRDPEAKEFHIWRFMVDAAHQGRGHGRRAAELLLEEARKDGIEEVTLNVRPGEQSALEFWQKLGFEDTGVVEYGQMRMRLSLAEPCVGPEVRCPRW